MSWLVRLWTAWVALWDRREPATAQVLVRIGVGLCVLFDLLQARQLGLVDALWSAPPDGMGYGRAAPPWAMDWLDTLGGRAELLWWAGTLAAAAFTIGLGTRVAGVVVILVSAQLGHLQPDGDRGIDAALRVFTLVLVFSSCHARWSIDAIIRRRIGRPFPDLVPAWPRLLLFAQLVWLYFSSGHNKVMPEWNPSGGFAALANVLSDPHFARYSASWVPSVYPLPAIATALTMAFEWGAPLLLLFAWFEATADRPGRVRALCNRLRLRWVWIAIGAGFHLGIAIFLRLGVFPWGMLACYPVLVPPATLTRIGAAITARWRWSGSRSTRDESSAPGT